MTENPETPKPRRRRARKAAPVIAPTPEPVPVSHPDPPAPVVPDPVIAATGNVIVGAPLHAVKGASLGDELRLLLAALNLKKWPLPANIILSLVCGLLTVLNQTTIVGIGFHFPIAAQTAVTWALAGFAWLGIGPIVGPQFAAALKIPPKIMGGVSILMLAGLTVAQQELPATWAAIVIAVVQIGGGLGFEPASIPTV